MAPQLGILCLAASLLQEHVSVEIVNLDQLFFDFVEGEKNKNLGAMNPTCASGCNQMPSLPPRPDGAFFEALVQHFRHVDYDVYGFGSICSSYPLTLRLAQRVKQLHPDEKIITGGPQASLVDRQTLVLRKKEI